MMKIFQEQSYRSQLMSVRVAFYVDGFFVDGFLVSRETVVLRRWESETKNLVLSELVA